MIRPAPTPPPRQRLVHNLAWVSGANLIVKPLWALFITAACMRVLGAGGYGMLSAALALATMLVVATEFGTNEFVTREVARSPERASDLFSNVLVGRLAGGALVVVAGMVVSWALGHDRAELAALLGAGAYLIAFRTTELCRALFRGFEILRFEAYSLLVERILVIAFGLAGLVWYRTPAGALGGMAVGAGITMAMSVGLARARLAPVHLRLFSKQVLRAAYAAALPIGLFGLSSTVLIQNGAFVIAALRGNVEAGQFGAGLKLVEMLMMLPMIACAAILPRLSTLHDRGDQESFARLVRLGAAGLGGSGVALALGLALFAPTVVHLLAPGGGADGGFVETAALLSVLGWAYPLMALAMLLSFALIASDEHRYVAATVTAAAIANLGLNLWLVGQFGAAVSVWALIGCQAAVVLACTWRLRAAPHLVASAQQPVPASAGSAG